MPPMDVADHNRRAWNAQANSGNRWSIPVTAEVIAAARNGVWRVILTPNKPVPRDWFGPVAGADLLCLASGGGQQAPILAAAGARVTSLDNSDEQLARDRLVADRDGLAIETVRGDMADLSCFADGAFDIVFHPVSNVFVPDVLPVWRECHRVLRPGGRLLAGFMNPSFYLFDHDEAERSGALHLRYALPFSDLTSISEADRAARMERNEALEFSHSLETQIGGQCAAGLVIAALYEDDWSNEATPLNAYTPTFIATLARKPPF